MNNTATDLKMDAGITRILKVEGYRLSEIIRAAFGKDVSVEINVSGVEPEQVEFIHDCDVSTKFKDNVAHIHGEGFQISINDNSMPF